jgi:hypothetical protein
MRSHDFTKLIANLRMSNDEDLEIIVRGASSFTLISCSVAGIEFIEIYNMTGNAWNRAAAGPRMNLQ